MKKGEQRKKEIIEASSKYILEHGVQAATLRNLAEAANTSDRMLMHYFTDKEELFTVCLNGITQEFIQLLDSSRTEQRKLEDLIPYLRELMKHPGIKPYIKLCLELITMASRKEEPFYTVGQQMCSTFLEAITRELAVEEEEERERVSALALVLVEGMVFLDALDFHKQIDHAIVGLKELRNK